MSRVHLEQIKISDEFKNSIPAESKLDECRSHWEKYHEQDRYIVVDSDGTLIDGYVQYLILKEFGEKSADILVSERKRKIWHRKPDIEESYRVKDTVYIYGYHPQLKEKKEFVWRVPASWAKKGWHESVNPGDTVYVKTKFGNSSIVVTRVETLNECPVNFPVKIVIGKKVATIV